MLLPCTLGKRIEQARIHHGHQTQRDFAAAIGIDEAELDRAERGAWVHDYGVFRVISDALGWPPGCVDICLEFWNVAKLPPYRYRPPDPPSEELQFARLVFRYGRRTAEMLRDSVNEPVLSDLPQWWPRSR